MFSSPKQILNELNGVWFGEGVSSCHSLFYGLKSIDAMPTRDV